MAMEWLSVNGCAEARQFGWLIGTASGTYAMAIIIVLIASAPAYRPDVPFAVSETARKSTQWILFAAQLLLLVLWVGGGYHVRAGGQYLSCYVWTLPLGALAVVVPLMLLMMLTAAYWVGRASAR
jgi:hypothetical protein